MSLTYTNNNVSNTVAEADLCTLTQAQSLAAQLGGNVVDMVQVVSPGATVTLSPGETGYWYAVTVDQSVYKGVYTPILCAVLLRDQAAGPGAWHVNPLNQQPLWVVTPPPVIFPTPAQNPPNPFPGFPGSQPSTTPTLMQIWNALVVIKAELDTKA